MRNTDESLDEAALNGLFAAACATPPRPSAALMDRLTDMALAELPRVALRQPPPRRGLVAQLLDGIGGWPALAGLATAGVAGLWIGLNPPQGMQLLFAAADLTELAPYDLSLLDEEG